MNSIIHGSFSLKKNNLLRTCICSLIYNCKLSIFIWNITRQNDTVGSTYLVYLILGSHSPQRIREVVWDERPVHDRDPAADDHPHRGLHTDLQEEGAGQGGHSRKKHLSCWCRGFHYWVFDTVETPVLYKITHRSQNSSVASKFWSRISLSQFFDLSEIFNTSKFQWILSCLIPSPKSKSKV